MVKIVPAKESFIVPFCLTCGTRWLILFFVLSSVQMSAQITRAWVGDTAQVKLSIYEGDTTYLLKNFKALPVTFIAYYDSTMQHKAQWASWTDQSFKDSVWFRNGKLKVWNESGSDMECRNSKEWYASGNLKSQSDCVGDTNVHISYYESGALMSKNVSYKDSGQAYVVWHYTAEYYLNGQLKFDPADPNGQRYTGKNYYKSGKKSREATLQAGGLIGPYHEWHENGQLKVKGQYETPPAEQEYEGTAQTGTWSYYNESGKLIKEEFYEEGKLVKTIEY